MTIERGKEYYTRDGRIMYITHITDGVRPVWGLSGVEVEGSASDFVCRWEADGRFLQNRETGLDLVREVTPKEVSP